MNKKDNVRVRFAPSPTGPFHIGGARTALFNWVFAKQHDGNFVLRIEDTDQERSEARFEDNALEALTWLSLDWQEGPDKGGDYGPYRQSERTNIYKKYLEKLLAEDRAYWCYCTKEELEAQRDSMMAQGIAPKYTGHCRNLKSVPKEKEPQLIRFKTPEKKVSFRDLVRGKIEFDTKEFGDIAIAKSLDAPLYNFAVVVDDAEMAISHVIRGEDHISNTPKQLLLFEAIGAETTPKYGHVPLILGPDKSKLSKRDAEVSLLSYREEGYIPEAMRNFLILLGWHPQEDKEVLSTKEALSLFSLDRVQKGGAIFNKQKLDWLNKEHLSRKTTEEILELLKPRLGEGYKDIEKKRLMAMLEALKPRMKTLNDFFEGAEVFFTLSDYDAELLVWRKDDTAKTKIIFTKVADIVEDMLGKSGEELWSALEGLREEYGNGSVLWPLRVALSGRKASPGPMELFEALGNDEIARRVNIAKQKLDIT